MIFRSFQTDISEEDRESPFLEIFESCSNKTRGRTLPIVRTFKMNTRDQKARVDSYHFRVFLNIRYGVGTLFVLVAKLVSGCPHCWLYLRKVVQH